MASKLDAVLRNTLKMGDEEFGRRCRKHRTVIWAIRTGRRPPDTSTANAILKALKKLGVEMTLDELIGGRRNRAA